MNIQPTQINLRVEPAVAATPHLLRRAAAKALSVAPDSIAMPVIRRRSIDARQRNIIINLSLDIYPAGVTPPLPEPESVVLPKLPADAPSAVVVGCGPAGLFAALRLIESGVKPILLERGKDVDSRRKDVANIARTQTIDPESNYCYGEGGAGTFSDGKLYTRSHKRGPVDKVLKVLHVHGADASILVDAHPHIGTDRLPYIIRSIRQAIEKAGGEVRFQTRVDSLILNSDGSQCEGVITRSGEKIYGPVILATGHSARDVYEFLHRLGVEMKPKGIAVGVRLEHPQHLIDKVFYHNPSGRGKYLPPAEYSVLTRVGSRAVYSFCMCPGGIVIPASNSSSLLVVNGMSPANRGSKWANTGLVVEVLPEDVDGDHPLRMMHYQQAIEQRFSADADGSQNAPAQRMTDFVASRLSSSLPPTSYPPGIHSARIDQLLPRAVATRMQTAFGEFGRKYRGYLSPEATLIGCETRTSAPVQVSRDPATLSHVTVSGLYPCGEGAGYAGGIVSAAIDGMRCAQSLVDNLLSPRS